MKRVRDDSTGQVAMEYLIVFTMAFFMTIPLIIIFSVQTNNMQSDIAGAQLNKMASEIIDAAEEVYYLGSPSQKTLEVTFPRGLRDVVVEPNSLVFYMWGESYNYTHYEDTLVNLTGSLRSSTGVRPVKVIATSTGVMITDG